MAAYKFQKEMSYKIHTQELRFVSSACHTILVNIFMKMY